MLIVRFIEKVCDIHKIWELLSAKEKSNFRITRLVNVIFKNILKHSTSALRDKGGS